MKQGLILKSVLSAAIIASLAGCATAPAQQWEADKTSNSLFCTPTTTMAVSGKTSMVNMAWQHVKR